MKHKEKDEKKRRKRIETDKTDPQSKLKVYEKKKKYKSFYISKSKDN